MASSSGCHEGPESGTPEEWDMDEWVTVTSNINEKLKTLEKDNDETVQEIEECFGNLTDEVCLSLIITLNLCWQCNLAYEGWSSVLSRIP